MSFNIGDTIKLRNGKHLVITGKDEPGTSTNATTNSSLDQQDDFEGFTSNEQAETIIGVDNDSFESAEENPSTMDQQLANLLASMLKAQEQAAIRQTEFQQQLTDIQREMSNARVSEKRSSVLQVCSRTIVTFDKSYYRNFISSVKTAYDEMETQEDKQAVLDYAKNRVKGNVTINNATIETFDEFKRVVSHYFKPLKDLRTIEREVDRLKQGKDETVAAFAKRTAELNEEFAEAFSADRFARGRKVLTDELQDLERKVIDCFISGLKERLQPYIKCEPDSFNSMHEALSMATKAESNLKNIDAGKDSPKQPAKPEQKHSPSDNKKQGKGGKFKGHPRAPKNDAEKPRTCYNCKEPGHFANACPLPKKEPENHSEQARTYNVNAESASKNSQAAGTSGSAVYVKATKLH